MTLKPTLAIWRKCKNSEMIKPSIVGFLGDLLLYWLSDIFFIYTESSP